jgi:hypothetical protein
MPGGAQASGWEGQFPGKKSGRNGIRRLAKPVNQNDPNE